MIMAMVSAAIFILVLGVIVFGAAWLVGAAFKLLPFRLQRKLWDFIDKF